MKKSGQHMQQGTHPRAVILMLLIGLAFVDRITSSGLFGHNVKKLKNARNIPALVAALHHNDPDVQFEAAEALGDIGDQAAVEPLATVLKTSEFSGVRWKAAEALSKLGDAAVPHLIPALSHQDEDVRWKSAIALGEIGNPESIGPLIALLCDRDRFVRSRAAYALGLLGEPAIEPLIHLLRDGDVSRRWGAALALGKIQDPRVIEPLIRALADRHESVRAESAASLAALGKPAVGPLLMFLKFADGPARLEVVTALGQLRDTDAIQPLLQLLESAGDEERKEVADALDAILIPAVEPLVRRIRNGNIKKG